MIDWLKTTIEWYHVILIFIGILFGLECVLRAKYNESGPTITPVSVLLVVLIIVGIWL